MLKTHQEEEGDQDENKESSSLELQEATDGKTDTTDEEKGAEN